ncbi:fasciclin domain-containing protein [Aquimarina intermedia]|uniref:Putative surface protein with fasciclin (FAS1) repeats n=1 Tax=Aquimarina intermedia TaxID=350814 RepID=A0A5S5BXC3_9FLAO|nr:fasciclin domain-containing protein [Aquimarina intermedia]TYP71619.1 putative surface protein with fasciclin (FAS1) repeats [Aquimarina intermedia]
MKRSNILTVVSFSMTILAVTSSFAQDTMMKKEKIVMVGGAAMYPSKNIVENALNSKDHTTLVAAVKAAELVATLQGEGPFTVFAPTNKAFNKLPKGTVETLVMPENKATLHHILTYHVLAGDYKAMDIVKAIKAGNGKAIFTTVNGGKLTAMLKGKKVMLMDEKGGTSWVTIADVHQSNGVIHVINTVLLPNDKM